MNIFKMAVIAGLIYSVMLCMYVGYATYVAILQADGHGTTIGSMMTFGCGALAGILFTVLQAGVCE